MLSVAIIMLVVLLIAAGVVVYAAFPDRHEPIPGVPWLGEAMERAAEAVPTLDEDDADALFADGPQHVAKP